MQGSDKPGWYLRLRYTLRRILWDIKRDFVEPEYYLLPFLVDPARAAVDVGGNYGAYAGKLATLTSRVHCFEPSPAGAATLRKRMPPSVVIHETAASDQAGTVEFFVPTSLAWAGALATIERQNPVADLPGERTRVQAVRLDDVIREPVGFMKIDVEGHELAVLRGAERILREDRPALLIESSPVSNPASPDDIFAHLAGAGYTGVFLFRGRMLPLSAFRKDIHQRLNAEGRMTDNHVFNFVFLPASAG